MFTLDKTFLSAGEAQALQQVAKTYETPCPVISEAWEGFKNTIKSKIEKNKETASIKELETMASTASFLVIMDKKIKKEQAAINSRKEQLQRVINDHLSELQ